MPASMPTRITTRRTTPPSWTSQHTPGSEPRAQGSLHAAGWSAETPGTTVESQRTMPVYA